MLQETEYMAGGRRKPVATGQSYQIGTRMLTRADLKQIRAQMEYWAAKLAEAEAAETTGGRNRLYHFVPRDV